MFSPQIALAPIGPLIVVLLWTVPVLVGYMVIRLAVRHGIMDAQRRLRAEGTPHR